MKKGLWRTATFLALAVALCFLTLPLLALFLRTTPADIASALRTDAATEALWLSFKTSAMAHVAILLFGTPAAYALATSHFRGRRFVIGLTELPLVLPPAVAGIALLVTFGRRGLLGDTFDVVGLSIPFTELAVTIAVAFVAAPFYVRQAIAAFEGVDPRLIEASRTLGVGSFKTFFSIALPLAAGGLGAGSALAWARGLGEFGATIMFAGSIQGETQTLPLAIYSQINRDFDVAIAIGVLLVVISAALLLAVRTVPSWPPFNSISVSRSEA